MYRSNYGVSQREREMTPEERERVEQEVRRWNEATRRQAMKTPNQARAFGLAASAATVVALALRAPAFAFAAGSLACILLYSSFLALRQAGKIIAASHGPFHPPSGGWRIEETDVIARSLVVAASGDEDYVLWWLLEVPGGDWFFFDPVMLTASERGPFTRLHVARLLPDGPVLETRWSGETIPRRGADDSGDGYAAAMAAGLEWRPEPMRSSGVVAASRLPASIRDIVNG